MIQEKPVLAAFAPGINPGKNNKKINPEFNRPNTGTFPGYPPGQQFPPQTYYPPQQYNQPPTVVIVINNPGSNGAGGYSYNIPPNYGNGYLYPPMNNYPSNNFNNYPNNIPVNNPVNNRPACTVDQSACQSMALAQCASPIIAQNCACKCSSYTPYNNYGFNNGYGAYGGMPGYNMMPGKK
uniref:ShKT domain-containing protein n=1 Tax=Meloidogyne hapla TaxID=6305 RepID=A0A1I8AZ54_MELHA